MCEVLDTLASGSDAQGMLSVDGGLARSRYFLDFLATALRRPIVVPANTELTAYGAALLAAGGAIAPACDDSVTIGPGTANVAAWRQRFAAALERSRGWRR
jgi:glycerol kinase